MSDSIVTGAGRGIGLSLVEDLAKRPNTNVLASVRSLPLKSDDKLAVLARPIRESSGAIPARRGPTEEGMSPSQGEVCQRSYVDVGVGQMQFRTSAWPPASCTDIHKLSPVYLTTWGIC